MDLEQPFGVIVHYGGQTPLKLAYELQKNGVKIIGTSPDAIDKAENRERFQQLVEELGLHQPANGTVRSESEAIEVANRIGYPLVVRPSYVLGGRAMEVVYHEDDLKHYLAHAVQVSHDSPVLLDQFLNDAIEVDIDAICDGQDVLIGGIMEHIEEAGIHSGDSACSLPAYSLDEKLLAEVKKQTEALADRRYGSGGVQRIEMQARRAGVQLAPVTPQPVADTVTWSLPCKPVLTIPVKLVTALVLPS